MKRKTPLLLLATILLATALRAQTVSLKQLGKDGILMHTSFGCCSVQFGGNLYTLDDYTMLYKTNLSTGEQSRLGNEAFKNYRFFFENLGRLYVINNDGSMSSTDAETGAWVSVSGVETWTTLDRAFSVRHTCYGIENGGLYIFPTANKKLTRKIGKDDFYNVGTLIKGDTLLLSLIGDGSLYDINLNTGVWRRVGKTKDWKRQKAGAVMNGKLYSVDSDQALYVTDLNDGTKKQIDNTQFSKASYLFPEGGKLYMVDRNGCLFEVIMN